MVALPASAPSPSCISVRPAATLSPHCDTEGALRPPAWVSAAFAPAHRSNPTTPTAGSRSHAIHRSRTTRGMPFAEAWIGADRFVRLRKGFWYPSAASTRPATRERRIWALSETLPGARNPVTVPGTSALVLPTLRTAGRTSRQRKAIQRCAVRLWKPIQQPLCRVVKRRRPRPDRFRIVSRFRIAARSTLIPTDWPAPFSRALPDRRRRERAAILAVLKSLTGEHSAGVPEVLPVSPQQMP